MKVSPLVVALMLTSAACGGSTGDETATPTATPTPVSFQDMSFEERQAYMATVVLPTMKAEFEAYDPDRFSDMSCATCHGAGATDGTFAMPNPDLRTLDPNDWPSGAGADFMNGTVLPMMVDLLDEEAFNSEDFSGFGCYGCHTGPE